MHFTAVSVFVSVVAYVQAEQYTTTTQSSMSGSSGGGGGCFTPDSIVETNHGPQRLGDVYGKKDIQLLAINDQQQFVYSKLRYWLHADPSAEVSFVVLQTESGKSISLTPNHLIYTAPCTNAAGKQTVLAETVEVGQCLLVRDEASTLSLSKVTAVMQKQVKGMYAPLTEEGSVIVDDIAASCFITVNSEHVWKITLRYYELAQQALQALLPSYIYSTLCGVESQSNNVVPVGELQTAFVQFKDAFFH